MVTTPTGVVVLTDRRLAARPLADVVAAAVDGGAEWVILRETDLGYAERRALADTIRVLLPPDRLIVSGTDALGGNAIHLPAAAPIPGGAATSKSSGAGVGAAGPLRARPWVVGRSCHNRAELGRLSVEDYVTLSPIQLTATKPGYGPPLGAAGAAALRPPVPWLALGGIDSADTAAACAGAGAAGVAVLGAVMRAADPGAVVRDLISGFRRRAEAGQSGMRRGVIAG